MSSKHQILRLAIVAVVLCFLSTSAPVSSYPLAPTFSSAYVEKHDIDPTLNLIHQTIQSDQMARERARMMLEKERLRREKEREEREAERARRESMSKGPIMMSPIPMIDIPMLDELEPSPSMEEEVTPTPEEEVM